MKTPLFIALLALAGCQHAQNAPVVPPAPQIYASADDLALVQEIADGVMSYDDGSVNAEIEVHAIAAVEADLNGLDPASPTWGDDLKRLERDMKALQALDKWLDKTLLA